MHKILLTAVIVLTALERKLPSEASEVAAMELHIPSGPIFVGNNFMF